MNIYESSLGREIAVIHHVPGLARHALRPHPHNWQVDIWVRGDPIAADGMSVIPGDQRSKILSIMDEYDGKDINELMPVGIPSLAGFTLALWERLTMVAPGLRELNVTDWTDDAREAFNIERED